MKKRILQVATTKMQYDGLTEVLLSLCNHANLDKCDIDVVLGKGVEPGIKNKLTGNINNYFEVPDREKHVFKYILALRNIIKKEKYDVIHVHGNSATMIIEIMIGLVCGVKIRIAHCHNTATNHPIFHKAMRPLLRLVTNVPVACGQDAGKFLYGNKNFVVIPNCICVELFKYNIKVRQKIRKKLDIEDKYVIGNVGRFSSQKNHKFLIDIFVNVHNIIPNSKLLLVGEGDMFATIVEKVKTYGIDKDVIFYGVTDDVASVMQAMDVFVLPSFFEGLCITAIEAQASGLPCVMSDRITREVEMHQLCNFISLEEPAEIWGKVICEYNSVQIDRGEGARAVLNSGYNTDTLYNVVANVWGL